MTSGLSLKTGNPLIILTVNDDNEKGQICILCDSKTNTQTNKISVMIVAISSTTVGDNKALARGNPFSVELLWYHFLETSDVSQ